MTILVSGQIDRIDTGRVGEHVVFGIVDYKTGKNNKDFKESDFTERMRLQLPLYALAAQLVPEAKSDVEAKPAKGGMFKKTAKEAKSK